MNILNLILFFLKYIVHKEISNSVDKCQLEVDAGMCRGYFEKFYYHRDSKSCKKFIFGGCGGNQNNFINSAECESQCVAKI